MITNLVNALLGSIPDCGSNVKLIRAISRIIPRWEYLVLKSCFLVKKSLRYYDLHRRKKSVLY